MARGPRRASMEEVLPQETLEAIMGNLDRETLCTARLVSRTFCAAASAHISSLTLESPSKAVSLDRFSCLRHVTVHIGHDESLTKLDPRLRAIITHLTVSHSSPCDRLALSGMSGMPKLRELECVGDVTAVDGVVVHHRSANLEVIRLGGCTPSVAMTITTMTWLSALAIGLVRAEPHEGWESADVSWLQHATNLRKLQALRISIPHRALPLIGNLTGLTGLTWFGVRPGDWGMADQYSIAPLSRLSMLRSLRIAPHISDSNLAIACSLGSRSLASLRLWGSMHASADCGRLLARQTALTRLVVGGAQLCNLRHLGALRLELLQSLEILSLYNVDAEGCDALQKATGLTHLRIGMIIELTDYRLPWTLGRLTQLRSLQLTLHGTNIMDVPSALTPLTALTKLHLCNAGRLHNGDLRALCGLTGLQVLYLFKCRVTDDMVPELAGLTNLRTLKLPDCGVTTLAPATDIVNRAREARGWPPVQTRLQAL